MGATAAGTAGYFAGKNLGTAPVRLGRTGWTVSPVGFGSYRIEESVTDHREALRLALGSGCNLIDTSTNYTDGSSERLVGQVLRELEASGTLARDQVVVVTKSGYVQGRNLEQAVAREKAGRPYPEMVKLRPGLWHCISPEFLEDQITASLERLGLDQIDVLLLHNPEYFLKRPGSDHAEYYRRLRVALEYLETEVARGRIQAYGISSNTLVDPKDSPEFTSLEAVLDFAPPGFQVIQFPFNLLEPGAVFEPNNTGRTLVELAHSRNLGTLANRPLNAFGPKALVRLADFPRHDLVDAENELKDAFAAALAVEGDYAWDESLAAREVAWAHVLKHNFEALSELTEWRDLVRYRVTPTLEHAHAALRELGPEARSWVERHREAFGRLSLAFDAWLEGQASGKSRQMGRALEKAAPALRQPPQSLSRKVVRIYRSMPGLHCVLVGMRTPAYVRDTLEDLTDPIPAEQAVDAFDTIAELGEEDTSPRTKEPRT